MQKVFHKIYFTAWIFFFSAGSESEIMTQNLPSIFRPFSANYVHSRPQKTRSSRAPSIIAPESIKLRRTTFFWLMILTHILELLKFWNNAVYYIPYIPWNWYDIKKLTIAFLTITLSGLKFPWCNLNNSKLASFLAFCDHFSSSEEHKL